MAIPYVKNDGPNYRVQVGLPTGGVWTLQPTDSASSFTATFPAANLTVPDDALVMHLAGNETATGTKTFSGGAIINGGSAAAGSLYKSAANGLDIQAITGSTYDFYLANPGNSAAYMRVPTGTNVPDFIQGIKLNSGTTLANYAEGTWTPSVAGLTIVGTPTYTGRYTRIGRFVFFTLRVQSTTSTASTQGSTTFSNPFTALNASVCSAANSATAATGYGVGLIGTTDMYPPTWPASSDITISGYFNI